MNPSSFTVKPVYFLVIKLSYCLYSPTNLVILPRGFLGKTRINIFSIFSLLGDGICLDIILLRDTVLDTYIQEPKHRTAEFYNC